MRLDAARVEPFIQPVNDLAFAGAVRAGDDNDDRNGSVFQREVRIQIPDAEEVLDLDPESSNVLCSRWGLMHKKAFLFNLDTKKTSKADLTIWRDHGYFLREAVVKRAAVLLEAKHDVDQ